ncbi:MAG: glycoside hydrolase family 5 protein [Chloroflexota bacterium]
MRRVMCIAAVAALLVSVALSACTPQGRGASLMVGGHPARGVNLGNALEAPVEGEWGMTLQEDYFQLIKGAGFNLVRIPIRWSAHALAEPPYTIDPAFFARVDWAVEQALKRKLTTVINLHHYDELTAYPPNHKARFLAMWRQIAERYRGRDARLYFEPLNEPNGGLEGEVWNAYVAEAIAVIRETNPTRKIVVDSTNWARITQFYELKLPADPHLIVSFHYYEPFEFTHQGAEWAEGSSLWLGKTWEGTEAQQRMIRADLDMAVTMATKQGWTLFMGEFGAYSRADMASRARWTRFLVQEAEARGIAWASWEFGAGFGVYDREAGAWHRELLAALIPDSPALK